MQINVCSLAEKEAEALDIIDRAILRHNPRAVFALFSGGHDSATSTHLISRHPRFTGVCHVNTGIGIEETRQYVRDVCQQKEWKLLEYKASENTFADGTPNPQIYRDIVLAMGFPSAPMHNLMYQRLKERQIYRLVRDFQHQGKGTIFLGTGVRRFESQRRMITTAKWGHIERRGAGLWVNPIVNWEANDCNEYMRKYNIPRNPVKELLCISAECLCGAFGSPEELEIIEACYPQTGAYLRSLEVEVKERGFPWGWGESPPAWWGGSDKQRQIAQKAFKTRGLYEQSETQILPLCHTCSIRHKEAEQIAKENVEEATMFDTSTKVDTVYSDIAVTEKTDRRFNVSIACIKGTQAGKTYYTAMVPLKVLASVFQFEDDELPPDLRSQRQLNERRAEQIAAYIMQNPEQYVFSSITANINVDDAIFEPVTGLSNLGTLHFSAGCRIIVLDGQHRQRGIQIALSQMPELSNEDISVDFHLCTDLIRRQQIFTDLNLYASKPNTSITLLYDRRNKDSERTRQVVEQVQVFRVLCEKESNTIKKRSIKLFTLSAIHEANQKLLKGIDEENFVAIASAFWSAVVEQIPDWLAVMRREMEPSEVRRERLHCNAIALIAMGIVGNKLINKSDWLEQLSFLRLVDWSRSNPDWEGKCIFAGRIQKNDRTVAAVASYLNTRYEQFLKA